MVSRGLSGAVASLLLLAGTSAFVPAKFQNNGVRSLNTNSANNKVESCESMMKRMDGTVRHIQRVCSAVCEVRCGKRVDERCVEW